MSKDIKIHQLHDVGGIHELKKGEKCSYCGNNFTMEENGKYTVSKRGDICLLEECPNEERIVKNLASTIERREGYHKFINCMGLEEQRFFVRDRWVSGQSELDAIFNAYVDEAIESEDEQEMIARIKRDQRLTIVDWMRLTHLCYEGTSNMLKAMGIEKTEDRETCFSFYEMRMVYSKIKPLAICDLGEERVEKCERRLIEKLGVEI